MGVFERRLAKGYKVFLPDKGTIRRPFVKSVPEFGIHSYLHPSTIAFIDLLHSTSLPLPVPDW
jgi:hypothetical protein